MKATPEQVQEGVRAGRITSAEGEYYLEHEYHKPRRQRIIASIFTVLIVMLSIVILNPGNDGLSGNIVLNTTPLQNNNTMTIMQPVTRLTASGTLTGEGNATLWFDTNDGQSLRVATITSDDGTPRTDKPSYTPGETITIEHSPAEATYYLDDGTTSIAVTPPFSAPENDATLLIVTTTQDGIVTYRLPIRIGTYERETTFNNLCIDTCTINATNGTLRVETSEGTTLRITEINADTQTPNNPPTNTQPLPTLSITETATIDLAPFFNDEDGDTLLYSTGTSDIATLNIEGSTLTITPLQDGTETVQIYASDLKELIATTLNLEITMPTIETPVYNETNTTENTTNGTGAANETIDGPLGIDTQLNGTNTTADTTNTTINTTETTINETNATSIDCSDPDPNKRPLECIQGADSTYFKPEELYMHDKLGTVVGTLTPVGNLLIKGTIVERSAGQPSPNDFQLGYTDEYGEFISTLWIDTATGDLHLQGTLSEANGNIPQRDGWSTFMNQRHIILAQADLRTGDMVVRGNLVPYRRSFE